MKIIVIKMFLVICLIRGLLHLLNYTGKKFGVSKKAKGTNWTVIAYRV